MIVSIHQPAYLPWLGYFDRIAMSDVHVTLDHVQFEKNSFINRNKIRTANGWCWLTVPVQTKGKFGALPINQLNTVQTINWRAKHWKSLLSSYGRAPFFDDHASFFENLYGREWVALIPLIAEITNYLTEAFAIKRDIVRSSDLNVSGSKQELVVSICKAVGADVYLSGPLGRNYLDERSFREAGIELRFHDYDHPEYTQFHSGFEANMAAIDLLMNHGPKSRHVLNGRSE